MGTVNSVGNSLTGSTGSGAFVGATSPTLVTPTLGAALATSINAIPISYGAFSDSSNLAIGLNSLASNASSMNNAAIGASALVSLASGDGYNLAIGLGAQLGLTTGSYNMALGASAMTSSTSSTSCVAIGQAALYSQTTGSTNIGIGTQAGQAVPSGATALTTGSSNIFIGYGSSSNAADSTGTIALGYLALANKATGATSGDHGPNMAIGSSSAPVGFRGNATPYSAVGASAGYWRIKLNGTIYKIQIYADS